MELTYADTNCVVGISIGGWVIDEGYQLSAERNPQFMPQIVKELPKTIKMMNIVFEFVEMEVYETGYFVAQYS